MTIGDSDAARKLEARAAESNGMWIAQLTPAERNTLIATFSGWALDGMDVMMYSFVIPALIATWRLTEGQAGLLATSALLISAAGGWLAGLLADRYGRVRILQLTIACFALFSLLSGLTNSFWQLLVTRGLQGLGFGGEWAVGSVLMGETIRAQHRGKAVGTVQAGWAVGWGLAALSYALLFSWLSPAIAWRAMFWIGILPALLVFYIRRNVRESEAYSKSHQTLMAEQKHQGGFFEIFRPNLLRITALTSLVAVGAQGGYYAITTWLPTFLKSQLHVAALNTGGYLSVVIAGSLIGYLAGAHLADRLGRKPTLILFAAASFATIAAYAYWPMSNHMMLALGFPLGFFSSGVFSPIGAFFTELFPTSLRGSGQGFSYSFGRALGAVFPALVGYLSEAMSLGHAIAVFAVSAYALMILAVVLLPETRGIDLHALD
jgi:MFS family permease